MKLKIQEYLCLFQYFFLLQKSVSQFHWNVEGKDHSGCHHCLSRKASLAQKKEKKKKGKKQDVSLSLVTGFLCNAWFIKGIWTIKSRQERMKIHILFIMKLWKWCQFIKQSLDEYLWRPMTFQELCYVVNTGQGTRPRYCLPLRGHYQVWSAKNFPCEQLAGRQED